MVSINIIYIFDVYAYIYINEENFAMDSVLKKFKKTLDKIKIV